MNEQDKYKAPTNNLTILGVNLVIFAVYTAIGLADNGGDIIGSFFAAVIHFVICCIMAIAQRRWVWFLAGILIIIIGLGTCVSNFKMGHM